MTNQNFLYSSVELKTTKKRRRCRHPLPPSLSNCALSSSFSLFLPFKRLPSKVIIKAVNYNFPKNPLRPHFDIVYVTFCSTFLCKTYISVFSSTTFQCSVLSVSLGAVGIWLLSMILRWGIWKLFLLWDLNGIWSTKAIFTRAKLKMSYAQTVAWAVA